jgi:hypothetical protein
MIEGNPQGSISRHQIACGRYVQLACHGIDQGVDLIEYVLDGGQVALGLGIFIAAPVTIILHTVSFMMLTHCVAGSSAPIVEVDGDKL